VQWLIHGSSLFSSLASSKELFFEYRCDEIHLESIRGVIKVTYEAPKPSNCLSSDAISELKYHKGSYFCRQSFEETSKAITSLPRGFIQPHKPKEHTCICCDRAEEQSQGELVKFFSDPNEDHHFISNGFDYHVGDSVYLFDKSELLALGKITSISVSGTRSRSKEAEQIRTLEADKVQIELDIFRRYDELLPLWSIDPKGQYTKRDERRLYYTGTCRTINATALEGRCEIEPGFMFTSEEELDQFKDRSQDTFYVSDEVPKEALRNVKSPEEVEIEHLRPLKTDHKPTLTDTTRVKEALTGIRDPKGKKLKGLVSLLLVHHVRANLNRAYSQGLEVLILG
jgi:hypothetical protein